MYLQNWPTSASFCLFSFVSNKNLLKKNSRLQQDPNSDHQRSLARVLTIRPPQPFKHTIIVTVINML